MKAKVNFLSKLILIALISYDNDLLCTFSDASFIPLGRNKDSAVVEGECYSSESDDSNFHDKYETDDRNGIVDSGAVCVDRLMTASNHLNLSDNLLPKK